MILTKLLPSRVLSKQARKPTGVIGRYLMPKIFDNSNADLNVFVKEQLDIQPTDYVLEVGFGTGKLIGEIADVATQGVVEGIDYSTTMYSRASKSNQKYVLNGRVKLRVGDGKQLPYPNDAFDKVCCVNTLYFWKEPHAYFKEIFRVTKSGGKVAIGFRDDEQMSRLNLSSDIFSVYSTSKVIEMLTGASFVDTRLHDKAGSPFLSYCAVAIKE